MNVAQLKVILDHLPDDTPIMVGGTQPLHVVNVRRENRTRVPVKVGETRCETGRCHIDTEHEWRDQPSYLHLASPFAFVADKPGRGDPEPDFEVKGRFLRQDEMESELDALDLMPPP